MSIATPGSDFVSCAEVARMTGLTRKSILKLAARNGIRTRKFPGLMGVRFFRPDVERVLAVADFGAEVRSIS